MFSVTDDDDFFTPTTSSNLASLFGTSLVAPHNSSTDLTYNAPKQPKPVVAEKARMKPKVEEPREQSSVVFAKPVNLFKTLNDGTHVSAGKYGLALIGTALQASEMLLYKDKHNILTRAKFHPNFEISLRGGSFSFTDDNKQSWSIHFESAEDLNAFVREVQLCPVKFLIDASKKNNSTRHPFNTDSNIKTEPSAVGNLATETENRLSEQETDIQSDSPSSHTRADILSRMARMGQSILPNPMVKTHLATSDSETDDGSGVCKKIINRKPKIKKELTSPVINKDKPTLTPSHINDAKVVVSPLPNDLTNQQYTVINSQLLPVTTPAYVPQVIQSLPNNVIMNPVSPMIDNLSLYFTENRTHNSEVRMNLSMITSKLDGVLGELSRINHPSNTDKLENDFLKSKVADLETRIACLTKKSEENESSTNESARLNSELKLKESKIQELKNKVTQLEKQLDEYLRTKDDVERLKLKETELNETVAVQQSKLRDLELFYEENKNNSELLKTVNNLNEEVGNLQQKLKHFEDYFSKDEESKTKRRESGQTRTKMFSDSVKQSMNVMFQGLLKSFIEEGAIHSVAHQDEMKNALATNVKLATYEILQHFRQSFDENVENVTTCKRELETSYSREKSVPPVPTFEC